LFWGGCCFAFGSNHNQLTRHPEWGFPWFFSDSAILGYCNEVGDGLFLERSPFMMMYPSLSTLHNLCSWYNIVI
jgi:hypothetical protein